MFNVFRRSMIARLLGLTAVALVTSGAQYRCSSGDTSDLPPFDEIQDPTGDGPTFTTRLVMRDSAGTETYSFTRGELITFEITVHNKTASPVDLQYTGISGAPFVFTRGGDQPLWYPGQGSFFAQVVQTLRLDGNETETFSITWNQELTDGTFLTRGNYRARGAFWAPGVFGPNSDFLNPHELASQLRGFTIR